MAILFGLVFPYFFNYFLSNPFYLGPLLSVLSQEISILIFVGLWFFFPDELIEDHGKGSSPGRLEKTYKLSKRTWVLIAKAFCVLFAGMILIIYFPLSEDIYGLLIGDNKIIDSGEGLVVSKHAAPLPYTWFIKQEIRFNGYPSKCTLNYSFGSILKNHEYQFKVLKNSGTIVWFQVKNN